MTTDTNTWPIPWRIAAALALESGLDWARWAYGYDAVANTYKPVPDPSDAEAYRADVARRGAEPGPMPALDYTEVDAEGFTALSWHIDVSDEEPGNDYLAIEVGNAGAKHDLENGWRIYGLELDVADVARLSALATAAVRAMGVGT